MFKKNRGVSAYMTNDEKNSGQIKNDLRIEGASPGKCSRLAPEIYIQVDETSGLYALHPLLWKSQHKVVLQDWPAPGFWREILKLYAVEDEYSFCIYADRVAGLELFRHYPDRLQSLLHSFGYSLARFEDISYAASLKDYNKTLFVEKKIPLKILRLLDLAEFSNTNTVGQWGSQPGAAGLTDTFATYLLLKEINGNIIKELITGWVDLDESKRKDLLQDFEDILAKSRLPGVSVQIQNEFQKSMYAVRYPQVHSFKEQILRLERALPNDIHVDFDQKWEKNQLRIYADVENTRDLHGFISTLNENKNILILEQLINLLNQA